uniref:Carrier domain-containing protein n=1 Tax=Parastrongyloides trichosuri TaxID=131310 RepID=A0A0N4ZHS0_PARTI
MKSNKEIYRERGAVLSKSVLQNEDNKENVDKNAVSIYQCGHNLKENEIKITAQDCLASVNTFNVPDTPGEKKEEEDFFLGIWNSLYDGQDNELPQGVKIMSKEDTANRVSGINIDFKSLHVRSKDDVSEIFVNEELATAGDILTRLISDIVKYKEGKVIKRDNPYNSNIDFNMVTKLIRSKEEKGDANHMALQFIIKDKLIYETQYMYDHYTGYFGRSNSTMVLQTLFSYLNYINSCDLKILKEKYDGYKKGIYKNKNINPNQDKSIRKVFFGKKSVEEQYKRVFYLQKYVRDKLFNLILILSDICKDQTCMGINNLNVVLTDVYYKYLKFYTLITAFEYYFDTKFTTLYENICDSDEGKKYFEQTEKLVHEAINEYRYCNPYRLNYKDTFKFPRKYMKYKMLKPQSIPINFEEYYFNFLRSNTADKISDQNFLDISMVHNEFSPRVQYEDNMYVNNYTTVSDMWYKFESVDTIIVNDKNLALVYEYKNVMVWQEIINMLCSSICFENDCNMIISIKIPIMITHDENLEVISNNFKYKLFYKGKKEILASISFKIIENHEEILFKTTNLLSNFFEENFILNDNNLEEDSKTFIEYGFDSLQLSSLEIKFYDLLNNHVTFEPLFLTKFNTPKKILDFIKSSKKVQKTKVEGNHEQMDKIVPTWNQKKFMFIKMYDFNYFSKLCEGVKIKLGLEKKFLLKIQEKINKIISKIDILRTTFNKKNNLVKLSCTETFIFLINSKKKMKNELTMSNYEIPLKIKVVFKENICKLIILLHHMAGDGQSFKLLLNYLYDNETLHGKYNQFSDYQQYELTYEKSQQYNNDKNFWKMTLKDIELEERTQAFNYNIETLSFKIPEVLMKKLAEIRKNKNISIFSLFVTIYKLLYYKIHQTTNKGIGIACENRLNFNFKNVIGPFMNIIPYFCPINIDANLSVILSTCNKQFIECLKHQMFSFDEIKKMTNNVNSDFFDVLFIQEPVKILDTEIKVSKIKPLYLECKEVWTFNCNQEYTIVDIKFNNNLINKTQMRTYVFGFLSIINDLNNSLSKKLKELNVYKSLSIEQKIKRNNYMSQSNIFEVIEKQSNLESTKIYEEENGTRYNMKYLNKECYEISLQLQEYYFTHYGEINTPDTPIVIHFERNIHLIKAVLCAIYSNLSIFPINPNCIHSEYNNWFLLDEVLLNKISQININEFNVQRNKRKRYDILYLTATSGSTGEPKIVCSELTGLLNLITEYTKKFFINEKSKIYQVVNYSFDIFFIDIFQGLFNGSDIILSKSKIPNLINFSKYQITHAYIMPAYLERLNRDKIKLLGDIQVLMYGGESLTESVLKELYLCSKELKIFQEFGLTEHSIYSNYKLMRVGENAKEIGPTFDNIGYGIIDADLKYLLPNSSGGKFFVTFNEGVSRGYIETPTLKNCFTFLKSSIKCLITGDLVSYDFTKKAFSFIGRTDSFIKIDGKQVNLTTIEECIFKNFPVQGIYITNFSNELNMNTYLVAHYTGKKQQNFKNILSKYIPSNWIPQYFIHHTEFPLNSNGKIDKNFLKKVKISEDNNKLFVNSVVITDSSLEHVLKVVRKYLYNENILPKDNIFDKGANSITLMMIIQELEDNYGVNVSIKDFFKHKTVESLIKNNCIIFKNEIGSNEKFLKDNPMDNIPLTYGQKFMWFANEYSLNDDEYIIKWELIFNKDIEITKIKYIIQCLLKINPTLRTVIVQNEFNLKQYCLSLTESFLNYDKTERSAPIDLSKDIPFQINIKSSKEIHLTFHHISVDGFSFQIIKDQVVKLFNDDFFDMKYIWDTSYHKYSIENNMKIKHLQNKSYYPIKYDKKTIQLFKNCVNINSNDITNDNISSYLLTILSNVLRKYSKDKLIVHIPISKRSYQYKSTVGYFVETYPFCVEFDEKDIRKRQTKIKERLLNVLSNEIPSYEDMITDSLLKQMEEQKYSLMLVYNNFKSNNIINVDKNTSIEINEVKPTIGKFDQTWIFELSENKLNINIEYCEQMFSYYEIVNLFEDFKKNLSTIDLTCRDKKIVQIIKNSLNIEDDIDIAKNFFELGGNSIIAALRTGETIVPETVIPIKVSKNINNVINILSILECGAAYNPIDESLPEGQINKYINESNALFFIDKNEMANIEPQIECMVNRTVRTNLAYVIYTSGTTGEPKGICINQTSVLNMILESTKNFYLSSDSIVYQFTRLSFDNSILEIFGTLCNGGVIYQRQSSYFDASEFSNDIITFKITHAMLFPGLVSTFNNEEKKVMSSLKYWIVGAEKLPINLLNEMLDKKVFTIQNYGPTETTGYCIFNVMRKNMNPQNIGKPIKNMRTLIKHNNSSNGELYVSGIGVTRGFLNKTENNDYFYNNWYKTGDLVEEADNGDIIFVERNDNQIKIRGFRVELTGIESVIIQFKNIKNCRVIYYEGKLFAIYVLENFKYSINEENLKNHCISLLPSYSIPNRFMKVSEIPLTKNMKLDKEKIIKLFTNKSLSKMNLESEVILKIWKKHLNVENISLIDNFFELGGNSINCVKIINEINSKFLPSLHITDIYRYETVENLMFNKKIKLKTNTDNVSTKYLLPDKFNFNNIQLSIQQNQMYIINHTKQYMHTHIMFVEEIELSSEKFLYLHNVFMKLICDNAMLRTIFVEDQSLNVITQRVLSLTEETENDSQEMEQTIGLFLNNLFLMIHLEDCDKLNIESIVKIIKKNVEECFNYKDLPWPFLKAKLRSISKECHLHDIYFNCRYDMEYSDKKEKSQLVEELENTNNEHILEPIQINIDKIDDFFVVEYKIHGDLMKIDASSSVFQNFENIIKEVLYYDNEKDKNNIQNLVMKIIKELLSIQLDMEINLNDNFYELGGSSLLFIKLSNLLKSHFNVDIRMDELLSCESIGDILSLVKNNKKDDSNIRVILFPPLFGNIQPYKYLIIELKNIFKNIEFIPITYPKYLSNFTNFSSLIQFLNITFQEKYQFTDVPTLFIGSSFGSIIAYEFYINASNIQRSYIINIDGVADNRCNKNYSFEEHEKYVINYLSNIRESICSDIKNENLITGVVEHSWNLLQLAIEYLPTTNFEKEIILFSCEENINPFLSWNLFTNVNLQIINGNHDNVLNEKNCKQIAEYIKNILS